MKKILKFILLLFFGFIIVLSWSFMRSGYISTEYFRPSIIVVVFFALGFVVKIPKLNLKFFDIALLLFPSIFIAFFTYYSQKSMFYYDLPLLPFWATLSFFLGNYLYKRPLLYVLPIFTLFFLLSNVLYVKNIGNWDFFIQKITSKKIASHLYQNTMGEHLLTKDSLSTNIASYKGKVVLLEFYTNKCAPCIQQIPLLQKLQSKFNKKDFEVLLINTSTGDNFKATYTSKYYTDVGLKILYDKGSKLTTFLNIQGVPQQFLVDKKALIISHITGSSSSVSEVRRYKMYEKLIAENITQ